jgi:hypothetical protein
LTENAENDTNGTSIMEVNQNTANINGRKRHVANRKLIICEIVFCGLAIRSVSIVIEMPVAKNSIRYQAIIDRN